MSRCMVGEAEKNQRGLMQQGRANRLTMDLMHIAEPHMASVWIKGCTPETWSARSWSATC